MPDNSFDVVSKIDLAEVSNAVQQALKEIIQRFDLKDSHSNIELKEKDLKLILASQDEYKLKAVTEILGQASSAMSNSYNPSPLMMGAAAYLVLFLPVVVAARWIETKFAWKR